jgi:DNA-binding NarL/FixJ family response regulator
MQQDRKMIRVIIVDDHAVVRDGVARILERAGDFALVIGVADNGIGIEPQDALPVPAVPGQAAAP